jgi:hypothetical protein
VQDTQRRLAAPCRNVSESTDLFDRKLHGLCMKLDAERPSDS